MAVSKDPPMEDGKFYHMIRKNEQHWFSPGSTHMHDSTPVLPGSGTRTVHFLKSRLAAGG